MYDHYIALDWTKKQYMGHTRITEKSSKVKIVETSSLFHYVL